MQKSKYSPNVIWLGITSLLTDISSEMIFPVLPFFLNSILGAPMVIIGFIEGAAEGVASITKYFSGTIADRVKKYKSLTFIGYAVSAVSKSFLFLAAAWPHVLAVRISDRLGKGIRTSPRDVLISASISKENKGKAFGLHRSLDSLGAFLGTVVAILLLWKFGGNTEGTVRLIFLLAIIPAIFSIIILGIMVKQPKDNEVSLGAKPKISIFDIKSFNPAFLKFIIILFFFGLANFSYAFYLLKAQEFLPLVLIPLVYLIYNGFYAASAFPAGKMSDRLGRIPLLSLAFFIFAFINISFALFSQSNVLFFLFAFYGIFIGIIDGVMRAFVSDLVEEQRQGQAFGIYHAVLGLTIFPANFLGGILWDFLSSSAPFLFAAAMGFLVALLFLAFFSKKPS